MAIGAFWFSAMSLFVKLAGRDGLPTAQIVVVRAALTLLFSYVGVQRATGATLLGTHRRLLFLRGLFGCLALNCFYYSLVHLPLGEATLIQYTNPVFAALLAAWLLGERVGRGEGFALAASLVGVAVIAQPAFLFGGNASPIPPLQIGIALAGAVLSGSAYVIVRRIGTREHSATVVFYLPLVTLPLTLPFAVPGWVWPTALQWFWLMCLALTMQAAQVFLTRGLQLERTARATAVSYLQIVFAGLLGAIFLAERPDRWTLLGAMIIVGSTLALALARPRRPVPPAGQPDAAIDAA